jgi:hypothetical protein
MRKFTSTLPLVGTLLGVLLLYASPAAAQASRTWVSGVGDDVNPCSRTAPCKTFAGAISKTAVNGEINCLDPAGFGTVTITKSITIDCKSTHGGVLSAGTSGVIVSTDPMTDARKSVRLRGLLIQGFDTGTNGVRILGTNAANVSEVFIEDSVIDGIFGSPGRGVSDERSAGGKLFISNTTIRNTFGTGISIVGGTGRLDASIDNVRVQNASFGVAAGNNARVMISRSILSGNSQAGVEAEGPTGPVEVNLSDSVSSNNAIGVMNGGGTVTIRLSNSDISFNTTGLSGSTFTHGNNRITGNASVGVAPTPISPAFQ